MMHGLIVIMLNLCAVLHTEIVCAFPSHFPQAVPHFSLQLRARIGIAGKLVATINTVGIGYVAER